MRREEGNYELGVEAAGNDVLRVVDAHLATLVERQLLPQELLVVGQLDHEGAVEHVLQPLGEEEGDQMAEMQAARRGTSARVEVEFLALFVGVENQIQVSKGISDFDAWTLPVREKQSTTQPTVNRLSGHLFKAINQFLKHYPRIQPQPERSERSRTCGSALHSPRLHRPLPHSRDSHPAPSHQKQQQKIHLLLLRRRFSRSRNIGSHRLLRALLFLCFLLGGLLLIRLLRLVCLLGCRGRLRDHFHRIRLNILHNTLFQVALHVHCVSV